MHGISGKVIMDGAVGVGGLSKASEMKGYLCSCARGSVDYCTCLGGCTLHRRLRELHLEMLEMLG